MTVIEKKGGYTPSHSGPRPTQPPPKPSDAARSARPKRLLVAVTAATALAVLCAACGGSGQQQVGNKPQSSPQPSQIYMPGVIYQDAGNSGLIVFSDRATPREIADATVTYCGTGTGQSSTYEPSTRDLLVWCSQ